MPTSGGPTVVTTATTVPMATPHMSALNEPDSVLLKKFGLTHAQVARAKSLRQLGVTEDDLVIAGKIMSQAPPPPTRRASTKAELVLGYDKERLNRERALKRLGVSEEQLDVENSKNLGALGLDGRKRSFASGGVRPARSASAPAPAAKKRGSWFAGSRRSSASAAASGAASTLAWFTCRAVDKEMIIEELTAQREIDRHKIEALTNKVADLEAKLAQVVTTDQVQLEVQDKPKKRGFWS